MVVLEVYVPQVVFGWVQLEIAGGQPAVHCGGDWEQAAAVRMEKKSVFHQGL